MQCTLMVLYKKPGHLWFRSMAYSKDALLSLLSLLVHYCFCIDDLQSALSHQALTICSRMRQAMADQSIDAEHDVDASLQQLPDWKKAACTLEVGFRAMRDMRIGLLPPVCCRISWMKSEKMPAVAITLVSRIHAKTPRSSAHSVSVPREVYSAGSLRVRTGRAVSYAVREFYR